MTCAMFSPDCHGRLEWHHAIKQQRIKREFPLGAWVFNSDVPAVPFSRHDIEDDDLRHAAMRLSLSDILGDTRNRIWLCSHHHELVTNGRLTVELPDSVWEFAREFGLDAQLENDLNRRSAA